MNILPNAISNQTQTTSPVQTPPTPAHTRSPRGKISRLPHTIREELNTRLDDGQSTAEILEWLNNLPKVRILIAKLYNGVPISPQNLSAWRTGGYQQWLHLTHFFDSAVQMREQVSLMQSEISDSNPGELPRSMADCMLTYLSVRFAAFMNQWDGSPSADHDALLKTATIIIKLQAAAIHAERASLELPKLREKALLVHLEHAMNVADSQADQQSRDELEEAAELRKLNHKSKPKAPSSSIKVKKGSQSEPVSASEPPVPSSKSPETANPAEPTVIENVNFTQPTPSSSPTKSKTIPKAAQISSAMT